MSLHPHVIAPVPEETARVARAAFPKGQPYLTFRDALGTIFQDEDFAALFPAWGQPGLPPWQLALVTPGGQAPATSSTPCSPTASLRRSGVPRATYASRSKWRPSSSLR